MKIEYTPKNFGEVALGIINDADNIIENYRLQNLDLTLRQLYYQFIVSDLFPEKWLVHLGGGQYTKNHERNYKKLGKLVNDARLAGLLSWDAIEDRTRTPAFWQSRKSPEDAVLRAARDYAVNPWEDQETNVEIWVEKEALAGVFESVAMKWHVPLFCCRGYHSQSSAWQAAMRIERAGKETKILHFGDHDPSGIDMTRDIEERFETFQVYNIEIERCALNIEQVRQFNPPPSPAKITDSRAKKYIQEFGHDSWELDAMQPADLQALAEERIREQIDMGIWELTQQREDVERQMISNLTNYL